LPFFADRHEAQTQFVGDWRADDKAARFDARHFVYFYLFVSIAYFLNRRAQADRVFEQCGDVAEHDALMRVMRDSADERFDHKISE